MEASEGVYRSLSPEDRRRTRSERLEKLWEAYGAPNKPLAQPCKIRDSFETPEARDSFCLGAYRPSADNTAEDEDVPTPLLVRQTSALPHTRCGALQRTDAPLCNFAPAADITRQRRNSMSAVGVDIAAEERRMSVELKTRHFSAPARLSVDIDRIWEKAATPRATVNPFNNLPNTDRFFT